MPIFKKFLPFQVHRP